MKHESYIQHSSSVNIVIIGRELIKETRINEHNCCTEHLYSSNSGVHKSRVPFHPGE
jgi:hypothetical protein